MKNSLITCGLKMEDAFSPNRSAVFSGATPADRNSPSITVTGTRFSQAGLEIKSSSNAGVERYTVLKSLGYVSHRA